MVSILIGIRLAVILLLAAILTFIVLFFAPFPYSFRIVAGKRLLHMWAAGCAWAFGLRVHVVGEKPKIKGGTLVVSNHMSYYDIFVLGSLFPTVFLAKHDVKTLPIVGWGAYAAGCLFVDRASARSGAKSIRAAARGLQKGATVISFPEGTTTKVEEIRKFKHGTFQPAVLAPIPVQPVGITYEDPKEMGWAEEPMFAHFKQTASQWSHHVYVNFGSDFYVEGKNAREASQTAQQAVDICFGKAVEARDHAVQQKKKTSFSTA